MRSFSLTISTNFNYPAKKNPSDSGERERDGWKMEEEIESKFEERGFVSDIDEAETFQKSLNFCINFKLGHSDLVSSWEVYYLNRQLNESVIRKAEMNGFLLHLQNEVRVREAVIKKEPNLHIYFEKDIVISRPAKKQAMQPKDLSKESCPSQQLSMVTSLTNPGGIEANETRAGTGINQSGNRSIYCIPAAIYKIRSIRENDL
ncbi:hypothetical protein MLD38_011880 [Melastoma candidum]|uniref:Uncharacterized protein n=1 Tax=Melastoma candidum TaxID=119954 RepID=A0ACB9R4I5_9MYRT|nr:hypothetical protein MLD38_011880 [Melastoma candidum]